ncbi:hypothetical protein BQ8482_111672 [Mesorhizobium delmotii]|uniref:Uncharacterized protein n=1 Tax=Mesorhizobium delmotii TaxID=1631247 RepID=A0A2P9AF38_9HYPH|nr:hypothetical protein BQ8482_111672 [Mesorhizobium delmotii]
MREWVTAALEPSVNFSEHWYLARSQGFLGEGQSRRIAGLSTADISNPLYPERLLVSPEVWLFICVSEAGEYYGAKS